MQEIAAAQGQPRNAPSRRDDRIASVGMSKAAGKLFSIGGRQFCGSPSAPIVGKITLNVCGALPMRSPAVTEFN
jgi:hypothetical protein